MTAKLKKWVRFSC